MAGDDPNTLRRAPIQARAKERIERILDAAEEVFVQVGYGAATTNQVAARAETSIGSIYEFFRNKQGLARGLADRYLVELADLYLAMDVGLDGRSPTVSTVVEALHAFYTHHPALGPLLQGCRDSEDLEALAVAFQSSLVQQVDRIISLHRQAVDPERRLAVAQMCGYLLWSVLGEVADKPPAEQPPLVVELKLLLTSYLATALPRTSG